jgi:hypothetical protein
MIDSDDVRLLRPVKGAGQFPPTSPAGVNGGGEARLSSLVAAVYLFRDPVDQEIVSRAQKQLDAAALLQTETAVNTYAALPVREGEHAIVAITRDRESTSLSADLSGLLKGPPRLLRLEPTTRSRLR